MPVQECRWDRHKSVFTSIVPGQKGAKKRGHQSTAPFQLNMRKLKLVYILPRVVSIFYNIKHQVLHGLDEWRLITRWVYS